MISDLDYYDFSVLICTYNGEKFILDLLNSIMKQNVDRFFVIISDDGSTDETVRTIEDYFSDISFEHYEIIENYNRGVRDNFLSAISRTRSEYLFVCDQDDIWRSNRSEEYMSLFKCVDKPHLIYSDAKVVDEDVNLISDSFMAYQNISPRIMLDDSILVKNCVQGATCCINKALILEVQSIHRCFGFEKVIIHDWLFAQIAKYMGFYNYIESSTIEYRQHSHNVVGAEDHTESTLLKRFLRHPIKYLKSTLKIIQQFNLSVEIFSLYDGIDLKNVEPIRRTIFSVAYKFNLLLTRL